MRTLYDRPYLLLLITSFVWGANAVASRLAVGHVSPMLLGSGRWFFTIGLLYLFARRIIGPELQTLRAHWLWIFVIASLGYTAFSAFNYSAAYYTTSANIGIIQGALPVMILFGARFRYGTPITPLQWAGIVVTMLGVAVLVTQGHLERLGDLTFNRGDVYMLCACATYALYTVAVRNRPKVSGISFFAACSLAALISSLPYLAWEAWAGQVMAPDATGWAILLFSAIFPSIMAQVFFLRGVELIGPGRAGLFINLIPVWVAVLGVMIGDPFHLYHAIALGLVMTGIAIAESGKPAQE